MNEFDINLLRSKNLELLTKEQIIEILYKAVDYQKEYNEESKGDNTFDPLTSLNKFMCVLEGEVIDHGCRLRETMEHENKEEY